MEKKQACFCLQNFCKVVHVGQIFLLRVGENRKTADSKKAFEIGKPAKCAFLKYQNLIL